jgi:hypothetical protein
MDTEVAFAGYNEGPLLFRPTYRYDAGTDQYDTSDKMRVPAWTGKQWCGRVALYKILTLHQIAFCTAVINLTLLSTRDQNCEVQITNQVLI